MTYFAAYVAALVAYVIADLAWLTAMTSRFYRPVLDDLLLPTAHIAPAIVFYLLYPVGLVIFAINPALKSGSIVAALTMGALFGLFTYGTYDLTNQATLRNWSTLLTIVDMAWGSIMSATVAAWAYWIVGKLISQT